MTTRVKCTSWWGHRFEPRSDEIAPTAEVISAAAKGSGILLSSDWDAIRTKTYRGDVCVRCGLSASAGQTDGGDGL